MTPKFLVGSFLVVLSLGAATAEASLTRDQFERRANAMCAKTEKRAAAITRRINNGKVVIDPSRNPVTSGRVVKAVVPLALRLLTRIGQLALPPADASSIRGWLTGFRQGYVLFDKGANALLARDVKRWERVSGKALRRISKAERKVASFDIPACVSG